MYISSPIINTLYFLFLFITFCSSHTHVELYQEPNTYQAISTTDPSLEQQPSILMEQPTGESREVVKSIESIEQSEGMGARVRRSIGTRELPRFDPFLMLD